jgi:NADH dehydrogenase [ubiquinone] 1 alpha subcomplex assembly factor 1
MNNIQFYMLTSFIFMGMIIFDFRVDSDISSWRIVDDVVMGGQSNGNFSINRNGHGFFHGAVSLENNGGFSSVRYHFDSIDVTEFSTIVIRLKGDGKKYQFRVKSDVYDRFSYVAHFETNQNWQNIEIPFSLMYPSFRGMKLNRPNYPGKTMGELGFLIANKKEESFWLEIDKISIK